MDHQITVYTGQLGVSGMPYFECSCGTVSEKRGGMTFDPKILADRRTHRVWNPLRAHIEAVGEHSARIRVA